MNEILLVVLIAFTLITFLTLNKKIGAAATIEQKILQKDFAFSPVSDITNVIYTGMPKNAPFNYSKLWSVTAVAGMTAEIPNQQNEITVIYHQPGKGSETYPYYQKPLFVKTPDAATDKLTLVPEEAVCVRSSISDLQYRHVLAALDDDML